MDYILQQWSTPVSNYPRVSVGNAEIKDWHWKRGERYDSYGTFPAGHESFDYIKVDKKICITTLEIDGKCWMVDDPRHWWFIQREAAAFHGHVLVAGLGLGLIVHALAENPDVKSITVVEMEPNVISLIKPLIPKCKIINKNWYEYKSKKKYDCVFFDLFVGDGVELLPLALREMLELRKRFPGARHRILGFGNKELIKHCEQIESAQPILHKMLK